MRQLSANDLADWLAAAARNERPGLQLVDVREPWELAICRIEGALAMPMATVPSRLQELDPDADTVVVCHHGVRSLQVALFLERNGFSAVSNLSGGVAAWADAVDPTMPRY